MSKQISTEDVLVIAMQEARERLTKMNGFSPFLVTLSGPESISVIESDGFEDDHERKLFLNEYLKSIGKNKDLLAYVLCSNTRVKLLDSKEFHDAIHFEMEVFKEVPMNGYQLYIKQNSEYLFSEIEVYEGESKYINTLP